MIYWESRKTKMLKGLLRQANEDHIKTLEKQLEAWKESAYIASGKYEDLLIQLSKEVKK